MQRIYVSGYWTNTKYNFAKERILNVQNFKVSDLIKVYAENVNDRNEGPIVSRREFDLNETWDLADKLCQSKEEVLAKIVNMNRNDIGMEVFDMFGAIFWTKELIEVENELRKRTFLMTYVRATSEGIIWLFYRHPTNHR
ncbi:MAG: hypothetical protein ACTS45_00730 [Candidatus Hodgkinia cicadicola]